MGWIKGLSACVVVVLMGVQASAAQEPVNTVGSCGDVVIVRFDGRTSVRFGRTAEPARPRFLALLRSSTGRYFVAAEEGLLELIVEKMPDGTNRFRSVTPRDGQLVATITAIVEGADRSRWCASRAGLLHLASVRDVDLTRVP